VLHFTVPAMLFHACALPLTSHPLHSPHCCLSPFFPPHLTPAHNHTPHTSTSLMPTSLPPLPPSPASPTPSCPASFPLTSSHEDQWRLKTPPHCPPKYTHCTTLGTSHTMMPAHLSCTAHSPLSHLATLFHLLVGPSASPLPLPTQPVLPAASRAALH